MDLSKQHVTVSVATGDKRRVLSPSTRTAPMLSSAAPAHLSQAHSSSSSLREEPKRHVNDVMRKDKKTGLSIPLEALPPETLAFAKRDIMDDVSSCDNSTNVT